MDDGKDRERAVPGEDERLAALAAAGDRDAFERLVVRHRASVYRLCRAATGCHADGDDAAQETFVRLHRSLPSFDPGRPFLPWLRKIAWNAALTVRRDGRAGVVVLALEDPPDGADEADGPEALAEKGEERRRVAAEAAKLSPELRAVLLLRVVEGLSYAEISEAAGIPTGTVMSRLSRARERLAAALREGAPPRGAPGKDGAGRGAGTEGRGREGGGA
jgi:RNA polymerase sigma-70 factor (ECF subfamily)